MEAGPVEAMRYVDQRRRKSLVSLGSAIGYFRKRLTTMKLVLLIDASLAKIAATSGFLKPSLISYRRSPFLRTLSSLQDTKSSFIRSFTAN